MGEQPQQWEMTDVCKMWTANAERRMHHMERARQVREARDRWFWLAKEAQVPHLGRVRIRATPLKTNRRSIPDVAACYPVVKAAIDGLVDAGVVEDDTPEFVTEVCFTPPEFGKINGLRIIIGRH